MITPLETLAHTPLRKVVHCPVCGDPRNAGHILCYACWNSISDADQRGLKYGQPGHIRAIILRLIEYRAARLAALGVKTHAASSVPSVVYPSPHPVNPVNPVN